MKKTIKTGALFITLVTTLYPTHTSAMSIDGVQLVREDVENFFKKPIFTSTWAYLEAYWYTKLPGSPLHTAIMKKADPEVIDQLIKTFKIDINSSSNYSHAPLSLAIDLGYIMITKTLLENGADQKQKNFYGYTPLHQALCVAGKLLEKKDIPVMLLDIESSRARAIIRLLLEHGADVNERYENGKTPLFFAWSPKILKELVRHKANLDAQDNDGNTFLHYSARCGASNNNTIVKKLIKYGAKTDIQNKKGQLYNQIVPEQLNKQ